MTHFNEDPIYVKQSKIPMPNERAWNDKLLGGSNGVSFRQQRANSAAHFMPSPVQMEGSD